jgi:transposase InsO family protein
MGPFPKSNDCEYILVAVDYVSKWVEALPCWAADSKHAKKMFHDGDKWCFIDKTFQNFLRELGIQHNIGTPYHP